MISSTSQLINPLFIYLVYPSIKLRASYRDGK